MKKPDYQSTVEEFENYAIEHTSAEPDFLYELYRETNLKTMYPRMLSGHFQGKFLTMICAMLKPERVLEIGTFTGYSAISLALGLPEKGIIHTIDSNAESVEIGLKYFDRAGVKDKIICHIGNAIEIIGGIDETFDLIFIDADKENYLNYYHLVFDKLRRGGIIVADNAFWEGKVLSKPEKADREALGIIEFNDFVQKDSRVENILVPIRDGLMMVRKL
jgi:predicted O-methyltransferase YrrM